MAPEIIGLIGVLILLGLTMIRMPIGLALGSVGIFGTWYLLGWDTMVFALGDAPVAAMSNYTLSVLPLFILMGIVAARAGFANALYQAAFAFVGHRKGGLAISSIIACGGFGAVCGSSLATVATMSNVAVPSMLRYGYSPQLAAGSVATGATLAILIPPSLPMIIYAYLTEVSIGKLFAAGIIPGILGVILYAVTISIWTHFNPKAGAGGERMNWSKRLQSLKGVWAVVVLFVAVLGGIFAGIFSPTEGAAVGAFGAIFLGFIARSFTLRLLIRSIAETVVLSSSILFIVIGVSLFNFFITGAMFPQALSAFLDDINLPPLVTLAGITLVLIILGCFLEVMAIIFITTPVLFPAMMALGYDPVWYGILTMMVVEIGAVTPPIGMNIFVLAKQLKDVSAKQVFQGIIPFLAADFVRLCIIIAFPGLVLWLPSLLF